MPKIFAEIEMSPVCYVEEVALWVAFGRIPMPVYSGDDYENEARSDPEFFLESGDPVEFSSTGYLKTELQAAGVDIDYDRYVAAKVGVIGRPADEYRAYWSEQFSKLHDPAKFSAEKNAEFEQFKLEWEARVNKDVEEAKWAEAQEAPLHPVLDRARASVFQALSRGTLQGYGWAYSKDFPEESQPNEPGFFVKIHPSEWTLRGIDWQRCTLTTGPTRVFHFIQVVTDDMLAVFERPDVPPVPTSGNMYGHVFIVDDGTNSSGPSHPAKRTRGRPGKADGMAKVMIQNMFRDRVRDGQTAEKAEALVQEAIGLVARAFDEKVSRSTIQEWFKPLRSNMPKNLPEIHASK